jgi:[ribosomal protein S18]-alanine N-acetyltransferase
MNQETGLIEFKTAVPEDVYAVKEIEIGADLSCWSIADYLLEVNKAGSFFMVAKANDKVVGFIVARLIMTEPKALSGNEIEIYNIAVQESFRGRSVAAGLLSNLFDICVRQNVEKIFLEVRRSNRGAQNFYLKHSFEIVGERRNFYNNPTEDAVLMCRQMVFI